MVATPSSFAARISRDAASRTCATEPGAELTSAEYIVWIESITQTSGRSASSVASTVSSSVSARISTCSAPPRRSARSFTCAADSSPVTSSARRSFDISARAVSNSVDFPTPGSPPTSTSEAGTSPPPRTRSNSGTPVGIRAASSALTSTRRRSGRDRASTGRAADELLDECPEFVAPWALAEPAPGGVAAVGARIVDGRLGHYASLGGGPDGNRDRLCDDLRRD